MRDGQVARVETPSGATTETTSAPATADGSANPGAESPPAAKGTGEQTRIDELTGNWRETQRDRDHWRELALKAGTQQKAQGSESPGSDGGTDDGDDEDIKTLADFKYDEKAYGKYIRELSRKDAAAAADKLRGEIKGERTQAEKLATVGEFQEKATSWAKEQKLEKAELMFASPAQGGPVVSDTMAEAIMTSEHGPEVLNYLARNTAESRRIASLTPALQGREIGRLEAKFATPPPQNSVSGAPPPHATVKGASDTSVKTDPAKQTDSEWWASKQRSDRAKRAAQK